MDGLESGVEGSILGINTYSLAATKNIFSICVAFLHHQGYLLV